MNEEIDFREYELVPPPEFNSPREMVSYMTGKDYKELADLTTGRDFTWEELKTIGADQFVLDIIMRSTHQPILLRKKR